MPVTSGPPALSPRLPPEPDFSGLCPPGLSGASCCPVATVALPEQCQPPPLSLSPSALPAPQPQHGALLSALVSATPLPEPPAPHFLHAFTRESGAVGFRGPRFHTSGSVFISPPGSYFWGAHPAPTPGLTFPCSILLSGSWPLDSTHRRGWWFLAGLGVLPLLKEGREGAISVPATRSRPRAGPAPLLGSVGAAAPGTSTFPFHKGWGSPGCPLTSTHPGQIVSLLGPQDLIYTSVPPKVFPLKMFLKL